MNTSRRASADYAEASIRVLRGLEPVRQRPGMYTRTDHPLHILQEVIDNAADEALAGHCTAIEVTLHTDGSVAVLDNGRGIPVGLHPQEGVPTVELVFTRLHAGGKFDKHAGAAYSFSGGLHGVGVSVTNALSKRLVVSVWRDGIEYGVGFAQGEPVEALREVGSVPRSKRGTRVRVWPEPRYFDTLQVPPQDFEQLLRSKAVLLPGLRVSLLDEKTGRVQQWHYAGGLRDYLEERMAHSAAQPWLFPPFEGMQSIEPGHDSFAEGEGVHWVLGYTEEGACIRESYVNLIPTPAGGTHESGLREGMFHAVKTFVELHALLPKGLRLLPEDVFSRASFVLSAKVLDPQFQGQVKERLNSRDALRLTASLLKPAMDLWLNQHVEWGRRLADMVIRQAQVRQRAQQKVEKRRSSGVAVLPGKLTDCESTNPARTEIFLVEGDSAGGSAKMGRDKAFQAILPLRGKVLNTWETDRDRLFANQEVHDVSVAIGIDPHGPHDPLDWGALRYGKVCILADADVDGAHIQVLLLTLFFRHFPQLVARGHVFVARPPLFRVDIAASGKRVARKRYCLDALELRSLEDKLRKEGIRPGSWSVSRFKGLGEMNAEQLWETTLNPDTRRLSPVAIGEAGDAAVRACFHLLMGKGESVARRQWLEQRGHEVNVDI
jgi:topoisomerase-4 subunit B